MTNLATEPGLPLVRSRNCTFSPKSPQTFGHLYKSKQPGRKMLKMRGPSEPSQNAAWWNFKHITSVLMATALPKSEVSQAATHGERLADPLDPWSALWLNKRQGHIHSFILKMLYND